MSLPFRVAGTQSRPANLPVFVLARNNLNASVVAEDDALVVRVVQRNRLPWARIQRVSRSRSLLGRDVVSGVSEGWEYLLHFREAGEAERLLDLLAGRGVQVRR